MPLFEYACGACGHRFEYLTRQGQTPTCPACASAELDRQLSAFAVGASSTSAAQTFDAPGACGRCGDPRGPGSCAVN